MTIRALAVSQSDNGAREDWDMGKMNANEGGGMTDTQIIPERLEMLRSGAIRLDVGSHSGLSRGDTPPQMCFNEAAAWITGERFTDAPHCISPVLRAYTMRLNDRWSDEDRQLLVPYVVRCVGTAGDGQDPQRMVIAQAALVVDLLPPWLRLAGLDEHADSLTGMGRASTSEVRQAVRAASDAAWVRRRESRSRLKAKVRKHLQGRPAADADADAVAAAAADAAAAAAAVADAAAAAAADAAADAAAVADAAAAAVAVAVADADADAAAAADAAADAVADADADAVAVADAVADAWGAGYAAARKFWDKWLAEDPGAKRIRDLAAEQRTLGLELLERMIRPSTAFK